MNRSFEAMSGIGEEGDVVPKSEETVADRRTEPKDPQPLIPAHPSRMLDTDFPQSTFHTRLNKGTGEMGEQPWPSCAVRTLVSGALSDTLLAELRRTPTHQ